MSSKWKLISGGTFLVIIMVLSIIYFCLPKIEMKINGKRNVTISIGDEYIETGANATLKRLSGNKELKVEIIGEVNVNKIGRYVIAYKSNSGNLKKEIIRVVNVIDDIKPVLSINGDVVGCKKKNLLEYDVRAIDNYDGDITDNIKYNINDNFINFFVYDSSNNKSEIISKVKYLDNEKPIISLNGEKSIFLSKEMTYEEYNATAYDICDGDLTSDIKIEQNVNTNVPGVYNVKYIVTDYDGNVSEAIRYVTVVENSELTSKYKVKNGATIYLTFDDGPGAYTEQLLDILDFYNVKATFFVTLQFPKYQHLIKEEYERSHTIGVHTYTHKWSIYSSVESYMEDFNKMNDIIYQETGIYADIFRFPGGSSNTVSRGYHKGIMTKLAYLMEEKGYKYYDWTFDSGDTNKKDNSTKAIINNVKANLKGDGQYIILMHDIKKNTIEALPEIIKFALANNYTFDKITDKTIVPHFKIAN